MGYTEARMDIQIVARTSNHGSPKDDRDRALWEAARAEVEFALAELDLERRYKAIVLTVMK